MDLPLPVAALARRARNAKSPKERHDTAYFAWEASVRLAVAARPPADATPLAMASIGQWVGALTLDGALLAEPAIFEAFALFSEVGIGKKVSPRAVTARALLDALPAYRNHVIGHGSARAPEFYDKAADALHGGLAAAWEAGVFWPEDGRLVYVDSVEIDATGARRARTLSLSGVVSTLETPGGPAAAVAVPEDVLPKRLYLRTGSTHRPLHPWILFEEADLRERVLFFNGRARSSRFLDYVSGEELKGKALSLAWPAIEEDLERLFARVGTGAEGGAAFAEGEPADASRFGDYRLLGKLGQGGMGVVYLARQECLSRLVALKMLPLEAAADPVAVARFRREVAALTRCDHPNVVKILASGEAQGTHYYAMELVEGPDLAQVSEALTTADDFDTAVSSASERVRQARSEAFASVPDLRASAPHAAPPALSPARSKDRPRRLAALFRDAARGVHHLHEAGIIHRDLKPGNLMVTAADHRVVVMDLGLAALGDASKSITKDRSALLGTLRYMPPEQLQRNLLTLDRRADVYSLGATLYELVTDRRFLDGDSEARLIEQVLRETPLAPEKAKPGVPRDLSVIIQKATQKDPRLRYDSAEAMAADLDAFVEGRPIAARAPTLAYVLGLAVRRNWWTAAGIVAAVVFVIAGTAFFMVRESGLREDAERERRTAIEQAAIAEQQTRIAEAKSQKEARSTRMARLQTFRAEAGKLELELQRLWDLRDRDGETDPTRVVVAAATLHESASALTRAAETLDGHVVTLEADVIRARVAELQESAKSVAHHTASRLVRREGPGVVGVLAAPMGAALSPDGRAIAAGVGHLVVVWNRDSGRPERALDGHTGLVRSCAFSMDGREILSCSEDRTLRLWDRASGRLVRTLEGHSSKITSCAFSPDGQEILSASDDRTLRLWERSTGALIRTFEGHASEVRSCAFSPDGREVLSGAEDRTLRLWDRATGRVIRTFEGHEGGVSSCAISPDGREILSGSWRDSTLRLWDRASGLVLRTFEGHAGGVYSCAFSPGGREILSSDQETMRLWDRASGPLVRAFEGRSGGWDSGCAFAPDGRQVLTTSKLDGLRLWDRATGRLVRTFDGCSGDIASCAFSPDGTESLWGLSDGTLRLRDRATGRLIRTFEGHAAEVRACAFSSDGREVLSASNDRTLRLWDRATGRSVRVFEGHMEAVTSCAFSPDGREVLSGSWDGTLRLWDRARGLLRKTFDGHADGVLACAFSPDGREILSGTRDTLRLWDCATGRSVRSFEGHSLQVISCAFSPDGREVLSGSGSTLRLFDRATGGLVRTFEHGDPLSSCAFSPDGREIISASWIDAVRLWDRASGSLIRTMRDKGGVRSCAFSPDGREILSATWYGALRVHDHTTGRDIETPEGNVALTSGTISPDGREVLAVSILMLGTEHQGLVGPSRSTLRFWDRATARALRSIDGHAGGISSYALAPDGGEALTFAWGDRVVRLWDRATGRVVRTFEGHTSLVSACAFAPDGREVLSASDDRTLRLWDRATGKLIRIFEGHSEGATTCAFSPDGRDIVSGSRGGAIRLWCRATGLLASPFEGHSSGIGSSVFSPDGREILSIALGDRTIRLWDRATRRLVRTFEGHSQAVTSCAFSPDGRDVLSSAGGDSLRLWDRATGHLIRTFEGAGSVASCAFAPEGREILSCSRGRGRLWDRGLPLSFDETFPDFDARPVAVAQGTMADLELHARPTTPTLDQLPNLVEVGATTSTAAPLDLSTADALYVRGLDLLLARSAPLPGTQSACAYLAAAAEQGHARAVLRLAWAFERGLGAPRDVEEASRIRAQAATLTATADADDPLVEVHRAVATKDLPLLRKASDRNEPGALLALADLVPEAEAAMLVERAAMLGDPAGILRRGERTARTDPLAAMDDYERAAGSGLPGACEALARAYAEGIGVERDAARAVQWRARAAQ